MSGVEEITATAREIIEVHHRARKVGLFSSYMTDKVQVFKEEAFKKLLEFSNKKPETEINGNTLWNTLEVEGITYLYIAKIKKEGEKKNGEHQTGSKS